MKLSEAHGMQNSVRNRLGNELPITHCPMKPSPRLAALNTDGATVYRYAYSTQLRSEIAIDATCRITLVMGLSTDLPSRINMRQLELERLTMEVVWQLSSAATFKFL